MATPWRTAIFVIAATRTELFLTVLALAAALLLAAAVIKLVDRWRKRRGDEVLSAEDQLAHFQQLHWRGELSKEEFERIQSVLGERIRREQEPSGPAAAPPPAKGPQPPEPPETGIRPQPPG
jgi:hypothetical protein